MDISRIFTENWIYKIAAIVLSVLLWLTLSADTELADQGVRTQLHVTVSDSAWSLVEVRPPEVVTTFRVRTRGVLSPLIGQPEIRKVVNQVTDSTMELPLSPSEVFYDAALDVDPILLDPSSVTILLERRARKRVPVRGRTDAIAEPGAFVVGMQLTPDSVWLQGPASFVELATEVDTELLEVGTVSQSVTRQLAIELPPALAELTAMPANVLGTVEIDSLRTRRFQRSVTVTGGSAQTVTLDPPSVTVSLTGPAGLIDGIGAADMEVLADIPQSIDGPASYPLRVELPPEIAASVTVDIVPERVTVEPASRESSPGQPESSPSQRESSPSQRESSPGQSATAR